MRSKCIYDKKYWINKTPSLLPNNEQHLSIDDFTDWHLSGVIPFVTVPGEHVPPEPQLLVQHGIALLTVFHVLINLLEEFGCQLTGCCVMNTKQHTLYQYLYRTHSFLPTALLFLWLTSSSLVKEQYKICRITYTGRWQYSCTDICLNTSYHLQFNAYSHELLCDQLCPIQ